jgi:ArsR family transcriptional regulator, arsenate/arsenite/antimonite-responsive transcriptional repressor
MSSLVRQLATDIDNRQYRCVSKSLTVLDPTDTAEGSGRSASPAGTECCPSIAAEPLSLDQAERAAKLLKALAEPVRLRLISLIASHPGGEACVCNLTGAFDLSQPTISHHLKVLHEAGLLDREKRGVWVYYRARTEVLASLATLIRVPVSR